MVCTEKMFDQRIGTLDLFIVPFFHLSITTAASHSSVCFFCEMLSLLRESWCVVCPNQPSRHPISFSRQVGHSGINVVPLEPASPAFPEYLLDVRINLAQIVERCGGLDGLR
jgi:hypothetical protein